MSDLQAQVWAEFATLSLALYWEAVEILLTPARWKTFICKGGALGKKRKSGPHAGLQIPREDAITSEIGEIVRDLRKKLPAEHFLREYQAHFEFEAPIASPSRAGRRLKVADHRVTCDIVNGPELAIEAKPLEVASDVVRRYLASSGIGCFLTVDPYSKEPLGAMWSYTMTQTLNSFQNDVLAGLQSFQPAISNVDRIVGIHLRSASKAVDCSLHDRSAFDLPPISLLHLESYFPCV